MKIFGRNVSKTCLSMLMIIVCLGTSLLFLGINADAKTIIRTGTIEVSGSLNLRKGPGTNYDVERQINKGVAITIVDQKMNGTTKWLKAKSGYWVCAKYMDFVKYV